MSERGVFAVDRGIWDHDLLSDDAPFSRRLAYVWLLERGPSRQKFKRLAKQWKWTAQEVRRFVYQAVGAGLLRIDGRTITAVPLGEAVPAADPRGWTMTRAAVLARDHYTCTYCGAQEDMACDHVIPRSKGGADTMDNLVAACRSCNSSKRDKLLGDWRK